MTKLVLFDLDGTLLNTLDDLAHAANFALRRHALPEHSVESYQQFVGNGIVKLVERMTPKEQRGDETLLKALKKDFDAYYAEHSLDCTRPYNGITELLGLLNERGITCVVLSNKPDEFTKSLCERYFGSLISIAIGHREGYPHKPDKALVEEMLRLAGFQGHESIYIGDSGVDMQTAKNAGLFAVGVLWGFRGRDELEENGADILISAPQELLKIIEART